MTLYRRAMTFKALPRMSAAIAVIFSAAGGCAPQHRPIFDAPSAVLSWPAEPTAARIRYVGQLRTAADLKPPRRVLEVIGEVIVGPRRPEPLYGPREAVCTMDGRYLIIADPGGRCLHILDLHQRTYRKITHAGTAPLLSPTGVALGPEGSVYLCDSEDVSIHQYAIATGALLRTLRLPEELRRPATLDFDAENRELLVVDVSAHNLKVLNADGRLLRILGRRGSAPGEFNFPCDVTIRGDSIWVADTGNHRVQELSRFGEPRGWFGQAGDAPGDLALPKGVALDSEGHVYVVDARFENVQIFDHEGHLLLMFGEEGSGAGQFWLPAGIFIDHNDRIWVCDSYNSRVQVFDYLSERTAPSPVRPARRDADLARSAPPSGAARAPLGARKERLP